MSNKKLAAVLVIIAVVLLGGFVLWKFVFDKPTSITETTDTTPSSANTQATQGASATEQSAQTYTAAQVAEHSTENNCWTIINGSVYNITSYVPVHPGGNEILQACGTDATTLFTQRTTTNGQEVGSGTPHSSTAQQQLARYKIGTLAQ